VLDSTTHPRQPPPALVIAVKIEHAEMIEMRRAAIMRHIETWQQLQQLAAKELNANASRIPPSAGVGRTRREDDGDDLTALRHLPLIHLHLQSSDQALSLGFF
jgi:hypothetical protein